MGIKFKQKGNFDRSIKFMKHAKLEIKDISKLNKYGAEGVMALSMATPKDTGETSKSWSYKVEQEKEMVYIRFYNSNVSNHIPVAILLQYGHGTRNGGYVQGIDYINPALKPIFERIANDAWKEVTKV